MSMSTSMHGASPYDVWGNIYHQVLIPAALEGDRLAQPSNSPVRENNPGWGGSNNINVDNGWRGQGRRERVVVEVHDYRRPFSIWDVGAYWGLRGNTYINNYNTNYNTTILQEAPPPVHPRRGRGANHPSQETEEQRKKREQQEFVQKVVRWVVGIAAGIGVYYTATSLAYSAGQLSSASRKINQMHKIDPTDVSSIMADPNAVSQIEKVIELRTKFLAEAKSRHTYDIMAYTAMLGGCVLAGLGAVFASFGLGVAGGVVVGVALLAKVCVAAYNSGNDDDDRIADAKTMAKIAKELAKIIPKMIVVEVPKGPIQKGHASGKQAADDAPPAYEEGAPPAYGDYTLYPTFDEVSKVLDEKERADNRDVYANASAPPDDE